MLLVDKNQLKAHGVGSSSGFFFVNFLYRARGGRRLKLNKSVKPDFQWPFLACWLVSFRKKEAGKESARCLEDGSTMGVCAASSEGRAGISLDSGSLRANVELQPLLTSDWICSCRLNVHEKRVTYH